MSIFNTKEEYLTFIAAWKEAVNSPKNKKIRKVCDHEQCDWDGYSNEEQARFAEAGYTKISGYCYTVPDGGHYKTDAWMKAEHYLLYNLLLEKDATRGFVALTNKGRINSDYNTNPWRNFNKALSIVLSNVLHAQKGKSKDCEKFLAPFNGAVTLEMLAGLKHLEKLVK